MCNKVGENLSSLFYLIEVLGQETFHLLTKNLIISLHIAKLMPITQHIANVYLQQTIEKSRQRKRFTHHRVKSKC